MAKSPRPSENDVEVGYRFSHVAHDSSEFAEFKKALESSRVDHYLEYDPSGAGYELFVDKALEPLVDKLVADYLPDDPKSAASPMGFTQALRSGFTRWTFKGRASRSEYWYFVLVYVLLLLPLPAVSARLAASVSYKSALVFVFAYVGFLTAAWWKVFVRRMHDRNVGGLKLALRFLPVVAYVGFVLAPAAWFTDSSWIVDTSVESDRWQPDSGTWSPDVIQFHPVLASGQVDYNDPSPADEIRTPRELLLDAYGFGYLVGPVAANGLIFESAELDTNLRWGVNFALRPGADGEDVWNALVGRCFSQDTSCPTGQIAIVLNGQVLSAPFVTEPVFTDGTVQITGDFTEQEAQDLVRMLNYGSSGSASGSQEPPVRLSREHVRMALSLPCLLIGVWNFVELCSRGRPARNRYDRA